MQLFADQYVTIVESISAINYRIITPLWVDWLVIIPVNMIDVSGLPAFEAYQILEDGITAKDLAEKFALSLEDFYFYNNIDLNHELHQGDWVLLPRERVQP
ncbi:MAG: hypothetical protein P1P73_02270 [Brevefilum sp.]|nr:hypothetical protein [Brevefilum sp.]